MTLDKLFNFDEQTLARQVMNERKYAQTAANDKNGWGNTVAGFSRLTDNVVGPGGLLGAKDPLLEKSSKIESILRDSSNLKNEDGTDMSSLQRQKSILNRMQQDPSLGKESLMLAEKIANDEAATSKIAYDSGIKEIELGNALTTAQSNREDKFTKQSDRLVKQVALKVKADPDFWVSAVKSVLPADAWLSNDFEGDTTGRALEALTMQLIDARKTDANGTPTGLMFNGLQQAVDTAKTIIKDSKPKAGFWWFTDDTVDMTEITRLADNEVAHRNGRPNKLPLVDKETLVTPEGLSKDELDAWNYASGTLKSNPEDTQSLKIIELLSK